ncbi:MAG: sensor histidine kinase [Haloferacaceae archaeon]
MVSCEGDVGAVTGPTSESEARRRMYRITADRERPFGEKLDDLLDLGCTHLGIVEGHFDLAEGTGGPEHFDQCRTTLDRMETLIDDLLALAREGDEISEREPGAVADLAEECLAVVATGNGTLRVETDRVVTGDPERLRQLFENLFRNAVEHGSTSARTQSGGAVTVTGGAHPDGLYVADDGPGIPDADRERVFDARYSTDDGGTGSASPS